MDALAVTADVAIVGAGPTGLVLANYLGQAGVSVLLVERNPATVQEPRAVSIDDESLRTMQALGLIDAVVADLALDYGLHYYTASGTCFAKVEPTTREFGYPRRNAFSQVRLEATLREGLKRFANVTTLFSHSCDAVNEDADGVTLRVTTPEGASLRLRATYGVGADGGRSQIRKVIGATLRGATYEERWLIVDLGATRERLRQTRVLCDPDRPVICLPGPRGTRRYEFMLREGEREEDVTPEAAVRALLAASGPDADAPIVRRQVYTFHARVADIWRSPRIFVAGDAAHLTPPFAGQGMNSGVRDAQNLAWKLVAVLRGTLGAGLLDSYQQERSPHSKAMIDFAKNIGRVMMPASHAQATIIQTAFRLTRLVPPLHDYFAQYKYKPKPYYRQGFLGPDSGLKLVGRMIPQPWVETRDGARARFDDVAGNGLTLLAIGLEAQRVARQALQHRYGLALSRCLAVVPSRYNVDPVEDEGVVALRDIDDGFARIAPPGREILLLLRPDRYVAAAADVTDATRIEDFAQSVRGLTAASLTSLPARATTADGIAA